MSQVTTILKFLHSIIKLSYPSVPGAGTGLAVAAVLGQNKLS